MENDRVTELDVGLTVYGNLLFDGSAIIATGMGKNGYTSAIENENHSKCRNTAVYYHPDDGWLDFVTDQPV